MDKAKEQSRHPAARIACGAWQVINSTGGQTLLYVGVVWVFQALVSSLRLPSEIYLDQRVMKSFLWNRFDAQLNNFDDIRRDVDIWTWGNEVLWPGLFFDSSPA